MGMNLRTRTLATKSMLVKAQPKRSVRIQVKPKKVNKAKFSAKSSKPNQSLTKIGAASNTKLVPKGKIITKKAVTSNPPKPKSPKALTLNNKKKSSNKQGKQKQGRETQKLQIISQILANDQEGQQKYAYLLKQINNPSSLKLLFRASQHNFSAAKFHQYCDGISDTVIIVRTAFGKTIAGYTPLQWRTSAHDQFVYDESKRSFLLQLQLREKMTLIQPSKAIRMYPNWGPLFGEGSDLGISDQCNQNQKSGCSFSSSYNCNGKYRRDQQSWTAFCGSPSNKFRVIEYEVFAVSM